MPSWPAVSGAETARRKPSCSGGSPRACASTASGTRATPHPLTPSSVRCLLMTFDGLRAGKVREDERLASYVLGTCRRMAIGLARGATRRQRLLELFGPELAPAAWSFDSPTFADAKV